MEAQWANDLAASLPASEAGWFQIFPEANKVIHAKICEWEEVAALERATLRTKIQSIRSRVPEKDQWFALAVIKYLDPSVSNLAVAQKQIRRLKWTLPAHNRRRRKWQDMVDRARSTSLLEVARAHGLKLRKSGQTYQALCPLHHERTASFHIYPPARFVCFGCGEKGDAIAFVQKIENCSFREAVTKMQYV